MSYLENSSSYKIKKNHVIRITCRKYTILNVPQSLSSLCDCLITLILELRGVGRGPVNGRAFVFGWGSKTGVGAGKVVQGGGKGEVGRIVRRPS